jgi:uncharacterized protein YycO
MTGPALGDFGLTRGAGWAMWAVRLGTASRWGHACVVVGMSTDPERPARIVEAMPDGVRVRNVALREWTWSNVDLSEAQRAVIVAIALDEVGRPYDWPSIAGFVLRRLGWKIRGRSADHPDAKLICSELVAWTYRQAGADMFPGVAPGDISPGDLAQYLVEH